MKKILVLTSGGDSPGMNAAIRAVVRAGIYYGLDVYGARSGYQGLIDQEVMLMTPKSVANCIQRGGTLLKTARALDFKEKKYRDKARAFCESLGIDGMVVIGGDGSFRGATLFEREGGPKCIGIPGTIDNDIIGTEYTVGFDTARNTALEGIDKIRDTASSHKRHFLVEVMGRSAGFLAVDVGIAGGAEVILIPEKPITVERLVELIETPRRHKSSSIVVVAEADNPYRSISLAKEIKDLCGIEYKACVLGHIQRGGAPTAFDRLIASRMGQMAVEMLLEGVTQKMIACVNHQLTMVDFPDPALGGRRFNDDALLRMNDILCA